MRGNWNGDVNLGNGELEKMRMEYDNRRESFEKVCSADVCRDLMLETVQHNIQMLSEDTVPE